MKQKTKHTQNIIAVETKTKSKKSKDASFFSCIP
jgi:hypothetical protein